MMMACCRGLIWDRGRTSAFNRAFVGAASRKRDAVRGLVYIGVGYLYVLARSTCTDRRGFKDVTADRAFPRGNRDIRNSGLGTREGRASEANASREKRRDHKKGHWYQAADAIR